MSTCIATLKPQYIQMPRTELERESVYEGFKHLRQFPNSNIGERFRLKRYFSINVQAVCKNNLQFTNIVARLVTITK